MGEESWNSLEAPWVWVSRHQPRVLQPWLDSARPLTLPPAPLWADVPRYQLPGLEKVGVILVQCPGNS